MIVIQILLGCLLVAAIVWVLTMPLRAAKFLNTQVRAARIRAEQTIARHNSTSHPAQNQAEADQEPIMRGHRARQARAQRTGRHTEPSVGAQRREDMLAEALRKRRGGHG